MSGVGVWNAAKTHCVRGHAFTPENTRVHPVTGKRACRSCDRTKKRLREQELTEMFPMAAPANDNLRLIRIPVQPLEVFLGRRKLSMREMFHPHVRRQVERARTNGYISLGYADEVAGVLGVHPFEIWGSDWFTYGEETA